jgi:hypothetical protein
VRRNVRSRWKLTLGALPAGRAQREALGIVQLEREYQFPG